MLSGSFLCIQSFFADFTKQCLSTIENDDDAVSNVTSTLLLRLWAKATLASGAWRDALVASASVSSLITLLCQSCDICSVRSQLTLPRVTVYRVICEHLESMDRMTDAVECFHKITNDMGEEVYASEPTIKWVCGEFIPYLYLP